MCGTSHISTTMSSWACLAFHSNAGFTLPAGFAYVQFFIKRADNPSKNMFEKDTDWLDGESVQVLMPIPVGS